MVYIYIYTYIYVYIYIIYLFIYLKNMWYYYVLPNDLTHPQITSTPTGKNTSPGLSSESSPGTGGSRRGSQTKHGGPINQKSLE